MCKHWRNGFHRSDYIFFIQGKSAQFLLIKIRTTLNSKKRRRLNLNIQPNAEGYTQISQSK